MKSGQKQAKLWVTAARSFSSPRPSIPFLIRPKQADYHRLSSHLTHLHGHVRPPFSMQFHTAPSRGSSSRGNNSKRPLRVLSRPREPPTVTAPTLVTSSLFSSAFLHTCRETSSLTNGASTSPAGTYQLPSIAARGSYRKHASSWPSWFQLMSTSLA